MPIAFHGFEFIPGDVELPLNKYRSIRLTLFNQVYILQCPKLQPPAMPTAFPIRFRRNQPGPNCILRTLSKTASPATLSAGSLWLKVGQIQAATPNKDDLQLCSRRGRNSSRLVSRGRHLASPAMTSYYTTSIFLLVFYNARGNYLRRPHSLLSRQEPCRTAAYFNLSTPYLRRLIANLLFGAWCGFAVFGSSTL